MTRIALSLLIFLVVAALLSAAQAPPAPAAAGEGEAFSTRFRVALVRVMLPANSDGDPLSLKELAGVVPRAIRPVAAAPAAAGYFGAIPHPHGLMKLLQEKGRTSVLFRGEGEGAGGGKIRILANKEFPVTSVDVRGDQTIVTTKFQRTGLDVSLHRQGDLAELDLKFSGVSARGRSGEPVIFTAESEGRFWLPDGFTAVLGFLDRVEGETLARSPSDWASDRSVEGEAAPADQVAGYFVFLTRLDLEAR